MNITAHFTWEEVLRSKTMPNQKLPYELQGNVQKTAEKMERVRQIIGCPVIVKSWYRSPELNKRIGGAKNSAHLTGSAVDFDPARETNKEAFYKIAASDLDYDQLIQESTADGVDWIHIGFNHHGRPRREILLAQGAKFGGKMTYRRITVS